jgi:high-affinity iron transporter
VTRPGERVPNERAYAWRGVQYYQRHCVSCHGEEGRGDGPAARALTRPPPDFTDRAYMRRQRPSYYEKAIREGVDGTAMARWDHRLGPADRWDAAYFVWSLSTTDAEIAAGAELYAKGCASCHGDDGAEGDGDVSHAGWARVSRWELAGILRDRHAPSDVPQSGADTMAVIEFLATFQYQPVP